MIPMPPRRCDTNYRSTNGECIACHAACGEVCLLPKEAAEEPKVELIDYGWGPLIPKRGDSTP